jgi:hypothetical protein
MIVWSGALVVMNGYGAECREKLFAWWMVDVVCQCKSRNRCGASDFLLVRLRCIGWDSLCLFILVEMKVT